MEIRIDEAIFQKYPHVEIGFLIADVIVEKNGDNAKELKESLMRQLQTQAINTTNFVVHPKIALWRKIYANDFGVSPKTFRSSIESLVKRVVTGKGIWNISNIVDIYNCCSVLTLLPMGGYDFESITGDIKICFAKENQSFVGLGEKTPFVTSPNQVVYADNERILCWLWNYKDCAATCIKETTKKAIFFIDGVNLEPQMMSDALELLSMHLQKEKSTILKKGILNKLNPTIII